MGALEFTTPQPEFNLPRSYLGRVGIYSTFASEPFFDGYTIQWTSTPGYIYRVAFKPNGYNWNSNVYSLTGLFDEASSSIDCILFPCFDLVTVHFSDLLNDGKPMLWFEPFATVGQTRILPLPTSPSGYWCPVTY